MKIVFINPKAMHEYLRLSDSWAPLGFAILAAVTPRDCAITFYDERFDELPFDTEADVVGITVNTFSAKHAYALAAEFKKRGRTVVMGGVHATLQPEEVRAHCDAVVVGEAEALWPRVLQDVQKRRLRSVYRSSERPSLDNIIPDFSIFSGKPYDILYSTVEFGRGCQYTCSYCCMPAVYKYTYVSRPVSDVITDIQQRDPKKIIRFVDNNLLTNEQKARELFERLIPLRVRWEGNIAIDAACSDELLDLMARSGCIILTLGLESLEYDNLLHVNKGHNRNPDEFAAIVKNIRKHNIAVQANFIFGLEADTVEAYAKVLDFAVRTKLFSVCFYPLHPFPGTTLYEQMRREGRLIFKQWWLDDHYVFRDKTVSFGSQLSNEQWRIRNIKMYKDFFGVRSIIRRAACRVNCGDYEMFRLFFTINGLQLLGFSRYRFARRLYHWLIQKLFTRNRIFIRAENACRARAPDIGGCDA